MEAFLKQNAQGLGYLKQDGLEYTMRKSDLAQVINLYPHYFTFTFVRNPFDRFVSIWKYSKIGQSLYYDRLIKGLTLKSYARNILENKNKYLSKFDKYHSIKQTQFILDYHPNSFFGVPRKTNANCDYIGRFENLDNDFAEVCRILNIRETKLPKINDSKSRRHYSAYYDDETRQMVEEIYKEDLEYLGYEFERIEEDVWTKLMIKFNLTETIDTLTYAPKRLRSKIKQLISNQVK